MKRLLIVLFMLYLTVFSFGRDKSISDNPYTNTNMVNNWVVGDYHELPIYLDLYDTYMTYTEVNEFGDRRNILMFRNNSEGYYNVHIAIVLPISCVEETVDISKFKIKIGKHDFGDSISLSGDAYYSDLVLGLNIYADEMEKIIDGLSNGETLSITIIFKSGNKIVFNSKDNNFEEKFIEALNKYKDFEGGLL